MHDVLECQGTWDVDDRFSLPILNELVANAEVEHDTVESTNVYYDTPDHDLRAQGILLCRCDGDDVTGWQLKVPDSDGGTELHWILSDQPPAELTALLAGVTLGKQIAGFAKVHTVRERYRIHPPNGRSLLVELDDDRVRASVGERLLAWREIEVDSDADGRRVAKRLAGRLRAAGARPSRHRSKLARISPPEPAPGGMARGARALADYVNAQIDQVVAGDIGLRRGQDPIHDTRVATRRLRSTLRVFGKCFKPLDGVATNELDGELKWFAGLLGEVRDCQVQLRRFSEALDDMPDELVLGPVRSRIRNDLQAAELPARTRVSEAMESGRYLALLTVLRSWRTQPRIEHDIATKALVRRARRARRKADRRLAAALVTEDDAMLHRARKAAKRARYAAELCRPLGKSAVRKIKYYKKIQSLLGDHQDTVVATEALWRMTLAAGTTLGENGFSYGILYAREQQLARQSRHDVRQFAEAVAR
jgi:CHAD domain-containing protein